MVILNIQFYYINIYIYYIHIYTHTHMYTYTHKYICCSMYARVKILSPATSRQCINSLTWFQLYKDTSKIQPRCGSGVSLLKANYSQKVPTLETCQAGLPFGWQTFQRRHYLSSAILYDTLQHLKQFHRFYEIFDELQITRECNFVTQKAERSFQDAELMLSSN